MPQIISSLSRLARVAPARLLFVAALAVVSNGCVVSSESAGNPSPVSFDLTDNVSRSGSTVHTSNATARSTLVARDLVNALVQIPALNPRSTKLTFSRPESSYGRVLAKELQRAGYDMRLGTNPVAGNYLDYTITATGSGAGRGPEYEFTVSVGNLKVRRQYVLEGSSIYPVSSLYVFGTKTNNIVLNDSIFIRQKAIDQDPVSQASVMRSPDPPPAANQSRKIEVTDKKNIYDTGRSNFEDLTAAYDDVQQTIIVFPNDSAVLGSLNKQLARDLASDFDPDTDLISVIGCSHGKTSIADGNRILAEGRSARVREELIRSGIDVGYVLDEGCWSPRHFDEKMPRRGVVLTLKRLRESG